jgi:glyoxylase-like metal-dependent hydrolase (beta-lactamase superfamily II)
MEEESMQNANAGIYQFSVGNAVVTALHDCWFEVNSGDVVAGIGSEEATRQQQDRFRPPPGRIDLSAFLIELDGQNILVDTGIGNHVKTSQIRSQLKRLGIEPAAVRTILLTHAHADHVGGLLNADGAAYFPNAEIILHEDEAEFWLDKGLLEKAPAPFRTFYHATQLALAPYSSRLRLVRGEQEVVAGVRAHHLPGHTPGHTGWRLDSDGDALLIWGDIVHFPGLQFHEPAAGLVFDVDFHQAIATRQRVLDMVATDRLRVAGMHLEFPANGHVVRSAKGYVFIPEVWTSSAGVQWPL